MSSAFHFTKELSWRALLMKLRMAYGLGRISVCIDKILFRFLDFYATLIFEPDFVRNLQADKSKSIDYVCP